MRLRVEPRGRTFTTTELPRGAMPARRLLAASGMHNPRSLVTTVTALALAACAHLPAVPGGTGSGAPPPGLVPPTPLAIGRTAPEGWVIVPDLVGKTRAEAEALVALAGFTAAVESTRPVECEGAPEVEGRINCQAPAAGATVRPYETVQINVYRPTRIAGAIVRSQLLALIGRSEVEARARLAGYGHDGAVAVGPADDGATCAPGTVCGFSVPESGMGVHDPITLYVRAAR